MTICYVSTIMIMLEQINVDWQPTNRIRIYYLTFFCNGKQRRFAATGLTVRRPTWKLLFMVINSKGIEKLSPQVSVALNFNLTSHCFYYLLVNLLSLLNFNLFYNKRRFLFSSLLIVIFTILMIMYIQWRFIQLNSSWEKHFRHLIILFLLRIISPPTHTSYRLTLKLFVGFFCCLI